MVCRALPWAGGVIAITPRAANAQEMKQGEASPKELVDALHTAFGEHHARACNDPNAKTVNQPPQPAVGNRMIGLPRDNGDLARACIVGDP